jgi:predicted transcriptional regulator
MPLFSALAARLGTIAELSRETSVAILAEALGNNVATLERHADAANADYGRYIDHLIKL